MKLSIIIPVYQVEQFIADCLCSVFDVTSDEYEVIIVNDGTKDDSMGIINTFATNHRAIRIYEQANQGLSAARMNGLALAKGDFVWFVDSDDYLLPEGVSSVLQAICDNPTIDVITFPLLWHFDNGCKDHLDYSIPESGVHIGKDLLKDRIFPVWAAPRYVIRKSLFESDDLFFPTGLTHEDEYFGRVLLYKARNVLVLNDAVYVYRQRSGSIMNNNDFSSAQNLVDIYRLLSNYTNHINKEDQCWFKKDIVCLLLETHARNLEKVQSDPFKAFRRLNSSFIIGEFNQSISLFSLKDRFLGRFLLHFPYLYSRVVPKLVSAKHKQEKGN